MYGFSDPYVTFSVYITVQQLDYVYNITTKKDEPTWTTVGRRRIGPLAKGQIITNWKNSPEVDAVHVYTAAKPLYQPLIYDLHVYI